jgi:hypothetical protein
MLQTYKSFGGFQSLLRIQIHDGINVDCTLGLGHFYFPGNERCCVWIMVLSTGRIALCHCLDHFLYLQLPVYQEKSSLIEN